MMKRKQSNPGGGSQTEAPNKAQELVSKLQQITEELVLAIDSPEAEAQFKALLKCQSKFHKYSFRNIMLIAAQNPQAQKVAGYETWKAVGRQVKKGEVGIKILAPKIVRKYLDEGAAAQETAPVQISKSGAAYTAAPVGFTVKHVFDISQTEGEALPDLDIAVYGEATQAKEHLEAVYKTLGVALEYKPTGRPGVLGYAQPGRVVVAPDLTPADTVGTMLHELTHALLHCKGDTAQYMTREHRKTVIETEAEGVAYIVGSYLGLDMDGAAIYIRSYNKGEAEETKAVLMESIDRISKTAKQIIEEMEKAAA